MFCEPAALAGVGLDAGGGAGRNVGIDADNVVIDASRDPVHFRPDLAEDPANQNLKNRIRILLAFTKNQFKHINFFHSNQISSDI